MLNLRDYDMSLNTSDRSRILSGLRFAEPSYLEGNLGQPLAISDDEEIELTSEQTPPGHGTPVREMRHGTQHL